MPALFCTVRRTPLLWVMARLMERERWRTKEYIPYPYIASAEGVKKLTNTETPLNFNVIFLSVSDSCCTTAQKDVGLVPHTEDSKYPMTTARKICWLLSYSCELYTPLILKCKKFLHMVTTEVTKWQLMKNYIYICKQGYHYNTFTFIENTYTKTCIIS